MVWCGVLLLLAVFVSVCRGVHCPQSTPGLMMWKRRRRTPHLCRESAWRFRGQTTTARGDGVVVGEREGLRGKGEHLPHHPATEQVLQLRERYGEGDGTVGGLTVGEENKGLRRGRGKKRVRNTNESGSGILDLGREDK